MSGVSRRRKKERDRSGATAAPMLLTPTEPNRPWVGWCLVAIVAAFLLPVVFHSACRIDDPITVLNNPRLNPPDFTPDHVLWYWSHFDGFGLYVPLTYTAWGLLAKATYVPTADELSQHVDPRVFHAASLLVHLANVAFVYALLRWLIGRDATRRNACWPAAVGALLYGLHPVQVEAIAWLSGLKDLLYVTASLGSVMLYLRAVDAGGFDSPAKRRWAYVAGLLLVPIGMLCKPTAMVAPLIAAAIDLLILRRPVRRVALAIAPYVLVAVPLALVAYQAQHSADVPAPPLWQRPVVSGASLAFYVGKVIAPVRLTFDYGWRPLVMLQKGWFWALGLTGLAGAAAILALAARRLPWVAAAVAVFIGGLLPVLGLTPFSFQFYSTVADHYLVLSMLGPALMVAWAASRLPVRVWAPVCAAWLLALGVLSILQLRTWRDAGTMARHMVAMTPTSALGHNALGELAQLHDDRPAAEREFRAAAANPDFLAAPDNLARLYAAEGRADEAIAAFHLMLQTADRLPARVRPNYRHFLVDVLGRTAYELGRREDFRKYYAEQLRLYGR